MSLVYLSPKDLNIQNHIAVLPCGALEEEKKVKWTEEQLKYYLTYVVNGNSIDTMFKGLIFNPIVGRKGHYIHSLYNGFGKLATIEDWEHVLSLLFNEDENIIAAAKTTTAPIDIWVCLPYPSPRQTSFGIVNGSMLDFRSEDNRFEAIKWWIDAFLKKWNEYSPLLRSLTFKGFVWQREALMEEDRNLVKRANDFIRTRGLLSMWLPNFGSVGVLNSTEYGFDVCCVNPNYYGNTGHDYQWINHTSAFIKTFRLGIQINYGKGILFNDHHLIDYLNLGLPQYNNYLEDCLIIYQFHNLTMKETYENSFVDYVRLYSSIKNIYTKVSYPGIAY